MPSPEDRQRPASRVAPDTPATRAAPSRVLPTPAGPSTVSRWQLAVAMARSYIQATRRSSGSPPTMGASWRGARAGGGGPGGPRAPVPQPVGDHRGALALEVQRGDPFDLDRVPDQPVGRL